MSRIETIGNATLYLGDCLDVLKTLPTNSVDSVVCDPPYGLSFMGKKWDYDVPSVEIWAECLRVLKPGGHLLAFAGTRTQHRMAVRIEDAGFEIRDMIAWVYGSGFPKSLDVSKAIDKAAGEEREVVGVREGFAKRAGLAERPNTANAGGYANPQNAGQITAPATDAARQWKGWGTALKPALEPITVARKALMSASVNVLELVESKLRERGVRGEILWKPESASAAAKSKRQTNSSPTEAQPVAGTSAKNVAESVTQNDGLHPLKNSERTMPHGANQSVSMCANTTSESATNYETKCLRPTEESAPAAESVSETSSPSTTSMAEVQSIGSPSTGRFTTNSSERDSQPGTECFAGIATGLTGSTAHVHIKQDSNGFYLWPKGLPKFFAGTPLTVAANVLEHGTGALNIDGCRVATAENLNGGAYSNGSKDLDDATSYATGVNAGEFVQPTGRWPANLIHDGSDEVVAAFPDSNGSGPARKLNRSAKPEQQGWGMNTTASDVASLRDAGTGSAARFFMQCKGDYNDAWQDLSLPQENANTAEQSSSQQRQAAVSALVLAVSSALPEGLLCSGLSMAPFTSATANELRLIAETATQTIQTIGSKFWRESKPARLSLSLNHASDAEIQRLTDTTTITVSRWKSDGSAEPVTFSITPMSLAVGGKDCAPSMDGKRFMYCAKASKSDRGAGNTHPTVKPTDLMAYLCRLITPHGGVVLDPFMGSGTTGVACLQLGRRFIGIERDPAYFDVACKRIRQEYSQGQLFEPTQAAPVQLGLEAA